MMLTFNIQGQEVKLNVSDITQAWIAAKAAGLVPKNLELVPFTKLGNFNEIVSIYWIAKNQH